MRGHLWLSVLLLLGGCSHLPGSVAQLQRFKDAEVNKTYSAIEAESVSSDCTPGAGSSDAVCAQINEIHARACMQLAREQTAATAACPPSSARSLLDCAAAGFAAVKDSTEFSPSQRQDNAEMQARALYCGATLRDAVDGVPMAQQAAAALAALPPNPGRDQLAASALLFIAIRGQNPSARCDAARQAAQLAQRGAAENPSPDMAAALQSVHRNALQAAANLPDCRL
jgi:hypothetical protein